MDKVLELFHDPVLGRDAAAALGVIADEGDRVLSKENFAVIRVRSSPIVRADLLTLRLLRSYSTSSGSSRSSFPSLLGATRDPQASTRPSFSSPSPAFFNTSPSRCLSPNSQRSAFLSLSRSQADKLPTLQLLPLLITSLDLPDPALRANVIETLGTLAKDVPNEMETSIASIVAKVLRGILVDVSNAKGAVVRLALSLPVLLLTTGS